MQVVNFATLFGLFLSFNQIVKIECENKLQSTDKLLINRQIHLVTSGFSSVFWNYIRSSSDSLDNVSSQCSSHLNKLLESSLEGHPLAFKFLSLSGSRPNNFLDATYAAFGSYDSCLAISPFHEDKDDQTIKGKYCLTSLEPDLHRNGQSNGQILSQLYPHHFDAEFNFTIKVGFCVPSVCSQNDVQQIITQAFTEYSWKLVDVHSCEVETNFFDRLKSANKGQQFFLWLLVTLVCVVMMATYMDLKGRSTVDERSSLFWIQQFSINKNIRSLFRQSHCKPRILILDQTRLMALLCNLSVHAVMWITTINAAFLPEDTQFIIDQFSKFHVQPFLNDWITDGLFFIGSGSASLALILKMGPKTPITTYLKCIFNRAALSVPILIPVIALEVILPLVGSGPIYQSINQYRSNVCLKTFWMNLLHIQNHNGPVEFCAPHTWTIAVEWQLFALSCFLVFIYKRKNSLGLSLNILMVIFGFYRTVKIYLENDLQPHAIMTATNYSQTANRMAHVHISTEAHLWCYLMATLIAVLLGANYEAKVIKFLPLLDKVAIIMVLMVSFSPALWNVFAMKIEPLTTIIYVLFSKVTLTFLALIIGIHNAKKGRKYVIKAESGDMYIHDDDSDSISQEMNQINNNIESKAIKRDSQLNNSGLNKLEILLRLLKPTYFIHAIVYSWYFTSLRSTIPLSLSSFAMLSTILTFYSIIAGFFFHLLVTGPVERINYLLSRTKSKAQ
uniref:Nose resistant-to-fluoxetine protein N-terminal domain-containing protein n=2 Tax=Tetranychus urticae TaxID=32264 RepID=T1K6S3_TETUR